MYKAMAFITSDPMSVFEDPKKKPKTNVTAPIDMWLGAMQTQRMLDNDKIITKSGQDLQKIVQSMPNGNLYKLISKTRDTGGETAKNLVMLHNRGLIDKYGDWTEAGLILKQGYFTASKTYKDQNNKKVNVQMQFGITAQTRVVEGRAIAVREVMVITKGGAKSLQYAVIKDSKFDVSEIKVTKDKLEYYTINSDNIVPGLYRFLGNMLADVSDITGNLDAASVSMALTSVGLNVPEPVIYVAAGAISIYTGALSEAHYTLAEFASNAEVNSLRKLPTVQEGDTVVTSVSRYTEGKQRNLLTTITVVDGRTKKEKYKFEFVTLIYP